MFLFIREFDNFGSQKSSIKNSDSESEFSDSLDLEFFKGKKENSGNLEANSTKTIPSKILKKKDRFLIENLANLIENMKKKA